MTDPGSTARELADEARVALGRLQTAWGWLTVAREPGSPGPQVNRPVDLRAAIRAADVWRTDRVSAVEAVRAGRKVSGPHPVPVRLGPSAVRFRVGAELVDLAVRMWAHAEHADPLVMRVRESNQRQYTKQCDWCIGSGLLTIPKGWAPWAWPEQPVGCPRCDGRGRVPTGDICPACDAAGPCRCDRADIAVALAVATIDEQLNTCDIEAAADADQTLYELCRTAEQAAGAGTDRRRLPGAECPVCGTREMVPEVSHRDPRKWAIYCEGPDCLCQGKGCPCGIGTPRRRDRRHMWPATTWDGPKGLAKRLGVTLPGTDKDTADTAARIRQARRERRRRAAAGADAAPPATAAADIKRTNKRGNDGKVTS